MRFVSPARVSAAAAHLSIVGWPVALAASFAFHGPAAAAGPLAVLPPHRQRVWREVLAHGAPPAASAPAAHSRPAATNASPSTGGKTSLYLPVTGCGSWADLAPDHEPVEALSHSMIYDSARDRIVVFGGIIEGDTISARVVALDLGGTPAWTDITPAFSGPSRSQRSRRAAPSSRAGAATPAAWTTRFP